MAKHSALGASSAYRWMACPGSIRLSKDIPRTTSVYAEEGTAAHELCEKCLTRFKAPTEYLGKTINGFDVDHEMVAAAEVYIDAINARIDKHGGELQVEHRFKLDKLYPGMWGTNDAALLTPDGVLHVFDFKYGRGVPVEVEYNKQLMYYGLGCSLEYASRRQKVTAVELVIVQPRCPHKDGPVRSQRLSLLELHDFSADLIAAAKATKEPDAPLSAGDHCRFCPALAVCPETRQQALATAQMDFDAIEVTEPPAVETLSIEQLSQVLPRLELLQNWAKAVHEHAHGLVDRGTPIPGFKLVAKRATRKWTDEDRVIALCTEVLGLKGADIHDRKLKSPAQLLKLVPKDQHGNLKDFIEAKSSGTSLVPDDDPRTPVAPSIESDFAASLLE